MSSRYFSSNEEPAEGNVFKITSTEIEKTKKRVAKEGRKAKYRRQNRLRKTREGADPYPGKAPVDPKALAKQDRGEGINVKKVKTKFAQKELKRSEKLYEYTSELAARSELLLAEDAGYLEGDDVDEFTARVTQAQIRRAVDEESAAKGFDLNLKQFGPYSIDYSRNGRYLLIGGRRGHVAAFEWVSKNLTCEINVQEIVNDVKWLHTENLFAVAQKGWTYIYDNQGIEIHCLKALDAVRRLEFLPYHFLLTAVNEKGFLTWLDVSLGKIVAQFPTKQGRCSDMVQNPWNACLCLSHSQGLVTFWTPNVKEPVAKMLAHRQAVTSLACDSSGNYLATAAVDRTLKIWDIRQFRCLQDYKIPSGAHRLAFSGRGLLCTALHDSVHIYKDCCTQTVKHPYLVHNVERSVNDIQFVPYEDVMGIGHAGGFTSILVPGSAEPNYDALEVNPYQTKTQRREAEVKSLLEKIQPDLICLEPDKIGEVDTNTLAEALAEKSKKLYLKPEKIDFEPRSKTKGKSGAAKKYHIKRTVIDETKRQQLKQAIQEGADQPREGPKKKEKKPKTLLDRLK